MSSREIHAVVKHQDRDTNAMSVLLVLACYYTFSSLTRPETDLLIAGEGVGAEQYGRNDHRKRRRIHQTD